MYHQGQHAELQSQLEQVQHELTLAESNHAAELELHKAQHEQQLADSQSRHESVLQVDCCKSRHQGLLACM